MAETPSIKIQRDYEDPPNISAEVPGEQPIREVDSHYQESTVDIQEMENGGHRVSYTGPEATNRQTVTHTVSTDLSREGTRTISESDDKNHAAKKSKIPLLKFQQTVNKVQNEKQNQKVKDQAHNKHRRSSIPKLKDAKAVKRTSSLKVEEKVDDEFEKIYEQVVDSKQNLIDDKILTVNIDDPEKVETKFEEIIHAYDSNDDSYFTPTEKLKLSKIPWRKKGTAANKTSSVDMTKTTLTNSNLKDGGFKVSATTITTKRFSRGNSMDLNNTQKLDVIETSIEQNLNDNEVFTEIATTEIIVDNPEKTKLPVRVVKTTTGLGDTGIVKSISKIVENSNTETAHEFEGGRKITKETITRIPIKPERVKRSISRDLNRRPPKLDDKDYVNREVLKHEEFKDGTSATIIQETFIKEPQIRSEKTTRSISRTFSRDGKSITLSAQSRQSYNENNTRQITASNEIDILNQISTQTKTENHTEDSSKLPTPALTKTTQSFIKGSIKNVERSKSVEWRAADEVITKKYNRTYSENVFTKHDTDDKKPEVILEKNKEIIKDTSMTETQVDIQQSSVIVEVNDENDEQILNDKNKQQVLNDENDKQVYVVTENNHISVSKHDLDTNSNNIEIAKETTKTLSEISKTLPSQEEKHNIEDGKKDNNKQNMTILKGNVSRLISHLSVQDTRDMTKKEIDVEGELPKKKSVLSKIAMFEGKDAAEYTIKIKKCTLDKKTTLVATAERNLTQPELDYLNNNVYVSNGNNRDNEGRTYINTPVIVDQIWKYPEENISTEHQAREVKILPESIDLTVSESNIDVKDSFPESDKILSAEKSVESNVDYSEQMKLLPAKLDFIPSTAHQEDDQMLTDKTNIENSERHSDTTASLPANINVIPSVSSNNIGTIQKYSLEKDVTGNTDSEKKVHKPKVGKLNFDLWNKQVQVNKQLVGKGKATEPSDTEIKAQKLTTTKMIYEKGQNTEDFKKLEDEKSESISLPNTADYTANISKNEVPILLPSKTETKSAGKSEMPTILPVKRDFKSSFSLNDVPKLLPGRIEYTKSQGQLQVPVILPETPLTVSTRLMFESQKSHIEVPVPVSNTTDLRTQMYTMETLEIKTPEIPKILPQQSVAQYSLDTPELKFGSQKSHTEITETVSYATELRTSSSTVETTDVSKSAPVHSTDHQSFDTLKLKFASQKNEIEAPVTISYATELKSNISTSETTDITENTRTSEIPQLVPESSIDRNSFDTPPTLTDRMDIITDKTLDFEKPKKLPEQVDFISGKDEDDVKRPIPGKLYFNYGKVDKSNDQFLSLKTYIDDLDKGVPSDPELVDSETEMRDTKDTIMGKLKNKLYLITSRNINKNKPSYYTEKSIPIPNTPSSVDDYTHENEFYSLPNENTVSLERFDNTLNLNITRNKVYNSLQDFEYQSREDKRSKSLAELDLGDAVKGQVQRMVYRIKSVDFDRIETPKSRKISLREMPKKSSVLEKILLFEGKANTTTPTSTKPFESTTMTKNITQPTNLGLTEEAYLRRMEELSTVKIRYNKTDMLYLNLGNGDQMPAIALGTVFWDHRLVPHIVSAAIDLGYRAIDTAFIYGTEQLVGQGIKKKIDDGTVTREELFIMGKLWSTYHKPDLVEAACRASLEALGLEYFDLYMIHNPMSLKEGGDPVPQIVNVLQFSQYDYLDAWFAMETLVSKGLVKAIGVSNFNSQQIQKILDKGHIKPLVNQVECHPYLSQQPLHSFCKERNITLSCFSVLGSKGTPAEHKSAVTPPIDDPLVKVMASGLNVTPAQLLVRYQIQAGRQAVIKATSPGHLYDILQALTFVLEPHQIAALNALNRNKRIYDLKKLGELHKNYPFNVPF